MKLKKGFVPALGTPLDENGYFIEDSFRKQVEDQINAGACALLCMGSMGQQAYLRQGECPKIAKACVEQTAGRIPVFVGAMDCSIDRAKERISAMEDLAIDGFVLTTPYYNPCSRDQVINFYKGVAASTKHNILLYDLASVTQAKITYDMVLQMLKEIPNLIGIKSADLQMFRKLKLNPEVPEDFIMVYSGLDTFDIAYKWGITNCLDGMLSCTPKNTAGLFNAMADGDYVKAAEYLSNIVYLRDEFVKNDLWPSFTESMNELGYAGIWGPDYCSALKPGCAENIAAAMKKIGEK